MALVWHLQSAPTGSAGVEQWERARGPHPEKRRVVVTEVRVGGTA